MPEIDAVAGLANCSHDFWSKNVLIEVGCLVLDDEDSPNYKECPLASFNIIEESRCKDEEIDNDIREFLEIHLYLLLNGCDRCGCYFNSDNTLLRPFQPGRFWLDLLLLVTLFEFWYGEHTAAKDLPVSAEGKKVRYDDLIAYIEGNHEDEWYHGSDSNISEEILIFRFESPDEDYGPYYIKLFFYSQAPVRGE